MPISATGSNRREDGFTLVELMVVLVIIGLASAAVVMAIPDPRGRVRDEAERFAARAAAVRDDAIVQARTMRLRIDGNGYAAERFAHGRWQGAGSRVEWTPGTGVTAPQPLIDFDATGTIASPTAVELSRDGAIVRVDFPGDGAVHVAR
jgi:type II secretion system protein H